jgi:hypothetical protein
MTNLNNLTVGPARIRMMDGRRIWCTYLGLGPMFQTLSVRLANGQPAVLSYGDIEYAVQARVS